MSAAEPINADARREFWFDDIWTSLDDAIVYAETAKLQAKVSDIGGVRRALERASAHFRLAREAVKKIEELDASALAESEAR